MAAGLFRVSALERGEDQPTDDERKAILLPFMARSAGRAMEKLIVETYEELLILLPPHHSLERNGERF